MAEGRRDRQWDRPVIASGVLLVPPISMSSCLASTLFQRTEYNPEIPELATNHPNALTLVPASNEVYSSSSLIHFKTINEIVHSTSAVSELHFRIYYT